MNNSTVYIRMKGISHCQIWVKVHMEKFMLQISNSGVLDQLNKLNPSKAQGPDGIPPWFLNTYAAQLAPILQNIFNYQSTVAKFLKLGKMLM